MNKDITGVHIHANAHSDRWHVYCEWNGARYHVGINRKTGELEPDAPKGKLVTLYKNPLPVPDENNLGQSRYRRFGEPGYFNTVKMSASGATGRAIIPQMLAKAKMLMEAAEAKLAAEQRAAEEDRRQQRRLNAIKNNAVMLYELAKEALEGQVPPSLHLRATELVAKIEREATE